MTQLAVQCKLCPVCDGTGTVDAVNRLPKKRHEHTCSHCQGQRYVPLVTCRGCGRAAVQWGDIVPYCGRKECWEKLVEVIDPTKPTYTYYGFPFGPAGIQVHDKRRSYVNGQIWDPAKQEYVDDTDHDSASMLAAALQFGWGRDY